MLTGISLLAVIARLTWRAPTTRHRATLHSGALSWHFVGRLDIPLCLDLPAGENSLMRWHPPLPLLGAWLALLLLLTLIVTLAYVPLGHFNSSIALIIAATKAAIVGAVFMELRQRGPRTFIFAGADCSGSVFCCGSR
jgi:cytochrome c oxidase subunit IV